MSLEMGDIARAERSGGSTVNLLGARSGKVADRRQVPLIALFTARGFMHNSNEVCIAPVKQLRDAPVEKALIRQ
jgi:hypothetical protein